MVTNLAAPYLTVARSRGVSERDADLALRHAQLLHPRAHRPRHPVRGDAQRRRGRRGRLRLAGRRLAGGPGAGDPRLPADPGHSAGDRRPRRRRPAARRSLLPAAGPPGPARKGVRRHEHRQRQSRVAAQAIETPSAVTPSDLLAPAPSAAPPGTPAKMWIGPARSARLVVLPVVLASVLPLPDPMPRTSRPLPAAAHRRPPVRHRPARPGPALPGPARRPGVADHRRARRRGVRRSSASSLGARGRVLRRLGRRGRLPAARSPALAAAADDAAAGGGPLRPVDPGDHLRDRDRPVARGGPADPLAGPGRTRETLRRRRPGAGPAPASPSWSGTSSPTSSSRRRWWSCCCWPRPCCWRAR